MPGWPARSRHALAACIACISAGTLAAAAAPAVAGAADVTQTTIDVPSSGEGLLALTASAPGTAWNLVRRTSAVATVTVDGGYSQDVVLFAGAQPFTYRVALGLLTAGRHDVAVRFNPKKSPHGASGIAVTGLEATVGPSGSAASVLRYAPILYGRDLPEIPGPFENNHTDTPLVTYHTVRDDGGGAKTIIYSVVWSNEDGGTRPAAVMARWGRTTDIEWVYRVHLDPSGRRIGDEYQDYRHNSLPFHGPRETDHPVLQTEAANNGVLPVDPGSASRYRFFMDPTSELPLNHAREEEMDEHPWTYAVSALELAREQRFEPSASPATRTISNTRNYLFVRLDKRSDPPRSARSNAWLGAAVAVKLKDDPRWYRSDHGVADWSVEPDGPGTTAVELPPGTRPDDIAAVRPVADPVGSTPSDWRIEVKLTSAFVLDKSYKPTPVPISLKTEPVVLKSPAARAQPRP